MRTSNLLQLGLIISLSLTLLGFEYSSTNVKTHKNTTSKMHNLEIEVIYDEVKIERPKVPIQNLPKEINRSSNTSSSTQQISTNIQVTNNQNLVTTNINTPTSDSVIIINFVNDILDLSDRIFDVVEEMPTYESLLVIKDKTERVEQTEKELLINIYKTIKYPKMALELGIQGKVYVQFVVNKDGEITNVAISRGVHAELDEEALNAVKRLPKMVPGKQRDKVVNVRYNIPIEFRLKK